MNYGISEPKKKKRRSQRYLFPIIGLIILFIIGAVIGIIVARNRIAKEKEALIIKERGRYSWTVSTENLSEEELESNPTTERINSMIAGMSLKDKISQMILVHPTVLTGYTYVVAAGDASAEALRDYPVGGILYDTNNFEEVEQTQEMLSIIQEYVKIPLLLTVDEDGSNVSSLLTLGEEGEGTVLDSMFKYKDEGPEKARENARYIAQKIKEYGINFDLAPVADVFSNPENTMSGNRAYSDNFEDASTLIESAVKGFHDGGIPCTLRHFPGYGEASRSTEFKLPVLGKTMEDLNNQELLPFKAGIAAGCDAIMMGNMVVPQVDTEPVPFSKKFITDILKGDMDFWGVCIVDMNSLKDADSEYTEEMIAVKAIQAGADMLMLPSDLNLVVKAITDAVGAGEISEERINDAVSRVLTLKVRAGLM